jgi:hypothetical protein
MNRYSLEISKVSFVGENRKRDGMINTYQFVGDNTKKGKVITPTKAR